MDPNPAASIARDSSGQAWFPPEKKAGPTTWGQKPELQEVMGTVIEREHDPQFSSVILGGGLYVPAKTPNAIVLRLQGGLASLLKNQYSIYRMKQVGIEIHAMAPNEFESFMRAGRWRNVAEDLQLKSDWNVSALQLAGVMNAGSHLSHVPSIIPDAEQEQGLY